MPILKIFGKLMERLFSITIYGEFLRITLQYDPKGTIFSKLRYLQKMKDFIYDLKISIDDRCIYDASSYPNDFHIEINGNFIYNQDLNKILDISFGMVKIISIIVPNVFLLKEGKHEIAFEFRKTKFMFYTKIKYIDGIIDFPSLSKFESIKQQAEASIPTEEKANNYFTKVRKIATIIAILIYLAVSIFLLTVAIRDSLDPVARQLDLAFSSAIAFVVWTLLGLAVYIYIKIIKS